MTVFIVEGAMHAGAFVGMLTFHYRSSDVGGNFFQQNVYQLTPPKKKHTWIYAFVLVEEQTHGRMNYILRLIHVKRSFGPSFGSLWHFNLFRFLIEFSCFKKKNRHPSIFYTTYPVQCFGGLAPVPADFEQKAQSNLDSSRVNPRARTGIENFSHTHSHSDTISDWCEKIAE